MEWHFTDALTYWRGPSPYWFVPVPQDACRQIDAEKAQLTYGWGVIPAVARIGKTEFRTSLFPRDGRYMLPVRVAVRRAEQIDDGDPVSVSLRVSD